MTYRRFLFIFQNVSICVSIFTLSCIAVDRYKAICKPDGPYTNRSSSNVKLCIIFSWTFAFVVAIPHLMFYEIKKQLNMVSYKYLTDCQPTWGESNSKIEFLSTFLLTFLLPLIIMGILYAQIACELWNKEIPGANETLSE